MDNLNTKSFLDINNLESSHNEHGIDLKYLILKNAIKTSNYKNRGVLIGKENDTEDCKHSNSK